MIPQNSSFQQSRKGANKIIRGHTFCVDHLPGFNCYIMITLNLFRRHSQDVIKSKYLISGRLKWEYTLPLYSNLVPKLVVINIYYYQYTRPNRKSASSKHTLSGPQKTDSGLLMHYQPYMTGSCFIIRWILTN